MASFQARCLEALDGIYRFVGGLKGPPTVELTTGVQLVHDVSREAELGLAPPLGLFVAGTDQAFAIAGDLEWTVDPYEVVRGLYPGLDMFAWLIDHWATADAAVTTCRTALGMAPYGNTIPRRDRLIGYWTSFVGINDQGVAPATMILGALETNRVAPNYPLPMPPGSLLRARAITPGAANVRVEGLFWAGPQGTRPPGMP